MGVRYLRLFVMFDLPVQTSKEKRAYRYFVKFLTKEGYMRIQFSIYSKLVLNRGTLLNQIRKLEREVPSQGVVQTLVVTEKQFTEMKFLVGDPPEDTIHSTDRMIEL